MAKRYYWLKVGKEFFRDIRVKKLRRIAGGDTYTVIYLKMMLNSLETEGIIEFKGFEKNLAEEIALALDEKVDNVTVTINFLLQSGLLVDMGNNQFFLPTVAESLGSESASTQRVRAFRERQKALQCNTDGTQVKQIGNVEKRREEKIREDKIRDREDTDITDSAESSSAPKPPKEVKHTWGEFKHVKLTDSEIEKLRKAYGSKMTDECIVFLDEYIERKGYKAKNHYLTIKKWVADAVIEERQKQRKNKNRVADRLESEYEMIARWAEGDEEK